VSARSSHSAQLTRQEEMLVRCGMAAVRAGGDAMRTAFGGGSSEDAAQGRPCELRPLIWGVTLGVMCDGSARGANPTALIMARWLLLRWLARGTSLIWRTLWPEVSASTTCAPAVMSVSAYRRHPALWVDEPLYDALAASNTTTECDDLC